MSSISAPTPPPRQHAVVAVGAGVDVDSGLADALELSHAEHHLQAAGGDGERAASRVVIKPVLAPGSTRQDPPRTYADPRVVQSLAGWLEQRGWSEVRIAVAGPGGRETARAVGYEHDVVDLGEEVRPFHYGGLIGDHPISRVWQEADIRIVVGKARTDRQLLYAGTMVGALGCVPDSDRLALGLRSAWELATCVADLLERVPIAFGVLDAWHALDGAGGPSDSRRPREPRALLACADLFALDWVLGELMDLDGPELSPVVREALWRRGPVELRRRGDLAEWQPWSNVTAVRAALADLGAGRWWGSLAGAREVPWTAR